MWFSLVLPLVPQLNIVHNKPKKVAQLVPTTYATKSKWFSQSGPFLRQRSLTNNYECLEQVMLALWHKWHNQRQPLVSLTSFTQLVEQFAELALKIAYVVQIVPLTGITRIVIVSLTKIFNKFSLLVEFLFIQVIYKKYTIVSIVAKNFVLVLQF